MDSGKAVGSERGPQPGVRRRGPRRFVKWFYYMHRWLGVAATGLLVVVCLTGILLNHKRALGLMPDVPNEPSGEFTEALPLSVLADRASAVLDPRIVSLGIDRMDVRPSDGIVKVRYDDREVTEVTVDIHTGEILHVGERNDQFLEKLHTGQLFGDLWILMSDAGALFLLGIMVTGYWLWLYPKSRV
jgi:hypothetical protein